jgi:DNA-binding PadR family transcriptional regulator
LRAFETLKYRARSFIEFDIDGDMNMLGEPEPQQPSPTLRHWLRHMAAVPKGFLRYQVLELLSERPLSGSEIMREIERRTNGCWRPSPGSVYPLLAWFQDNGLVREVPAQGEGVRRYELTEEGRKLLEEQRRLYTRFFMDKKLLVPQLLGFLRLRLPPERLEEARGSLRRMFRALLGLALTLEERFSEEALREAIHVLDEASRRLEDIERRLRGEGREGGCD